MSEYCPKCGETTSEDDSRLCAKCQAPSSLAAATGSPPMTADDFEAACRDAINGNLWDASFSLLYSEAVSLGIVEMRYIANLLRAAQGKQAGVVKDFTEKAENAEPTDRR